MAKHSIPHRKTETIPATFETVVKSLGDAVRLLPTPEQVAAGRIEEGYRLVTPGLHSKAATLKPRTNPEHREMTDEEDALITNYRNWRREVKRRHMPDAALMSVITDGLLPVWADVKHGLPMGTTAQYLIESLSLYVRLFRTREAA